MPHLEVLDSAVSGERGQDLEEGTAFVDGNRDADIPVWQEAGDIRRRHGRGGDDRVIDCQRTAEC